MPQNYWGAPDWPWYHIKVLNVGIKTNTKCTVTPIHPDHICLNNTTCTKRHFSEGATLPKIGLQWLQFINITNQNDVGAPWLLMHSIQRLLIVFRITVWSKACHSWMRASVSSWTVVTRLSRLWILPPSILHKFSIGFRSGDSAGHSILTTLFWIRAFWTSRAWCAGTL